MKTQNTKIKTFSMLLFAAALILSTICTAQIKVDASGEMGVGITGSTNPTAPELRAHILGALGSPATAGTTQTGVLRLQGVGSNTVLDMGVNYGSAFQLRGAYMQATNRTALGSYMNISLNPNGGNVGVGVDHPTYQFQVLTNSAGKPTSSTWSITSDIRTKTNITNYTHGLDLVRLVRLISYQYNGVANTPAGENGVGVIAQEFQQIFPNSVKPFSSGSDSSESEPYLGVDLHELFIANVAAVQQLDKSVTAKDSISKAKTDSLSQIISTLQNQLNQLSDKINSCCSIGENRTSQINSSKIVTDVKLTDAQSIVLEQNVPNPFAEQTSINYYLPEGTQKAQLLFYNSQGRLIQSTDLIQKGKGTVNVFASDLSNGIYTYTLVVDEKVIETKKMVKQ